ncbi:hypothetical protein AVEN_166512-1 [Araneus ventricosus]|uniref:Reverse transcriptase zinc-binding domain-containing protein n=1 Tax=Araneus ventricosus TaxID=182803 RepID=A0A4Y2WL51_ARAVE|nr:hypothetical protein AVEN_166512-1 [Araneus ventricosus]
MEAFGKPKECSCGTGDGTVSHYIFVCPIYIGIRQRFFPGIFHALGILEIIRHPKTKIELIAIVQNLLEKCIHTTSFTGTTLFSLVPSTGIYAHNNGT